jgi:signal transduction histidine kinase
LLRNALEVVRVQADAMEISLTVDCPDALPERVSVDPEKVAWAVVTLAGNALRHVRRGTRNRPGGSIVVTVQNDVNRGEVAISVQDDGPGIPPERIPWLFARQPGRATAVGLALMLIRDVVAAHGGDIQVESETQAPDSGTTVTLRLPAR